MPREKSFNSSKNLKFQNFEKKIIFKIRRPYWLGGIPGECVRFSVVENFVATLTGMRSHDHMPGNLRGGIEIQQLGIGHRGVQLNLSCAAIGFGYNFTVDFFGTRADDSDNGSLLLKSSLILILGLISILFTIVA